MKNTLIFREDSLTLNDHELFPKVSAAAITKILGVEPKIEIDETRHGHLTNYVWNEHGLCLCENTLSIWGSGTPKDNDYITPDQVFSGTISILNRFLFKTDSCGFFLLQNVSANDRRKAFLERVLISEKYSDREVKAVQRKISNFIACRNKDNKDEYDSLNTLHCYNGSYSSLWEAISNSLPVNRLDLTSYSTPVTDWDAINCHSDFYDSSWGNSNSAIVFEYPNHNRQINIRRIPVDDPEKQIPYVIRIHFPRFLESVINTRFRSNESVTSFSDSQASTDNKLMACPACGESVAKSARNCMKCGADIPAELANQGSLDWRFIQCPRGHVLHRFAECCPIDGTPNVWYRNQVIFSNFFMVASLVGTLLVAADGGSMQHIYIAATCFAAAVIWRFGLPLLRWYYRPKE